MGAPKSKSGGLLWCTAASFRLHALCALAIFFWGDAEVNVHALVRLGSPTIQVLIAMLGMGEGTSWLASPGGPFFFRRGDKRWNTDGPLLAAIHGVGSSLSPACQMHNVAPQQHANAMWDLSICSEYLYKHSQGQASTSAFEGADTGTATSCCPDPWSLWKSCPDAAFGGSVVSADATKKVLVSPRMRLPLLSF